MNFYFQFADFKICRWTNLLKIRANDQKLFSVLQKMTKIFSPIKQNSKTFKEVPSHFPKSLYPISIYLELFIQSQAFMALLPKTIIRLNASDSK